MRTPLGRSLIVTFAALGWITTALSAVLAVIPSEDEEHKEIYVFKILGLSAALLGAGVAVYFAGRARKSKQPHEECGGKPRSPAV
jgi:hypothetical protein